MPRTRYGTWALLVFAAMLGSIFHWLGVVLIAAAFFPPVRCWIVESGSEGGG
jgi:hypothetical protein